MTLRPYQARAVGAVRSSWALGYQRVCLISPTGSGKTTMAAALAEPEIASGGRVLMLTHTREIHRQAVRRMPPGTVVAMVQTLARRGANTWCERTGVLSGGVLSHPSMVVWDEAHHLVARSFSRVASWFPCRFVGLTATPNVPGMAAEWDDTVIAALPSELARDGYLCPVTLLAHGAPDTSTVRVRGDEYDAEQLAAVTNVSALRGDVLGAYLQRGDVPAIGFAVNRAHSKALTADFLAAGIRAEHLDGGMSPRDRDAALQRFADGTTRVLWNCDLLGEGLDVPGCELVIQARPLHSLRAFLQQVGRCRRTSPGKAMSWVHDHGGNLDRHGHPDMDRDYSLPPSRARRTRKATGTAGTKGLRLVVEHPADAYQIDPALAALGFEPDRAPEDVSETVTEKLPGLAA